MTTENVKASCLVVGKEDWDELIVDYKSMCLKLGGTTANCQTEVLK